MEPWWQRDLTFPGFWKIWPAVVLASLVVGVVLAVLVAPVLVLTAPIGAMIAFVWLWGPRGRMRRGDQPSS